LSHTADEYGYEQADKQLEKLTSDAKKRYGTYLENLADRIISEARSNLQNDQHVVTGDLVASVGILEDNEGKEIVVGTPLAYGAIIEDGRPEIKPVHAKALHWFDKDGNEVFAKSSKAVEASPWLLPACISQIRNLPRIWMDQEGKAVKEASV
jgi:hypothetical protein